MDEPSDGGGKTAASIETAASWRTAWIVLVASRASLAPVTGSSFFEVTLG
jgi:hypothetical protein